ncbi:hypothetical protein KHS38_15475 [Mucilaginibacter sp. Bleaf8]|uniref:YMGG-like glycine zipper-containing protein n=1 Tax=Mucilaginibacter sp. Bleaf8 TaxID=2834430 RepID=UPI001BCEDFF9|nr:YMGG-like glycine zipper-containing protein [Mucilaginibacter sp. Bleaf8]MBS7565807.1 hypothetical protein [Mucilaginibacter sp. Bleaf8]
MKKMIFVLSLITGILFTNIINADAQRRMSSQAKGALIGGAGGALLGAVVGHDLKSALIGGAIGAGGGYIIGNEHRMNKNKRYAAYHRGYSNGYYTRNRDVNYRSRGYARNVRYVRYR